MSLKTLVMQIPEGKKKPIRLSSPLKFNDYLNILSNNILNLNLDNKDNLKIKYQFYIDNFSEILKKRGSFYSSDFGFNPNRLHIMYYLDRGWEESYAMEKISSDQSKTSKDSFIKRYGETEGIDKFKKYISKKSETFSKN